MVQYHPTTLAENGFLITEGARGEGAHLLNERRRPLHGEVRAEQDGARLARRRLAAPSRPRSTRAAASARTARASVSTSPSSRASAILEALREIVNIGKDFAGVDITREPIMIRPGQHYIMGGVKTDIHGATPVPGLYAAGEVACVSVHGGNRLGANSLLDTLIFGRRSGEHAAERALLDADAGGADARLRDDAATIAAIIARRETAAGASPRSRRSSATTMNADVAVYREADGLSGRSRRSAA